MFDELKGVTVWTVLKAEPFLEPSRAFMMGIYCENSNQLTSVFQKKLYQRCSNKS